MTWTTAQIPDQTGRRALITGATSGIGFHDALELSRKGAEVILPARTEAKSAETVRRIREAVPGAKAATAVLDLASQDSVRSFAADYAQRFPGRSLDLLINNAGVMALPARELTVDGFERQFATNFLGPFALTARLFPHLKAQYGTRIVTVSSVVANHGEIDFDNLQSEKKYVPLSGTYSQSKLADLIFTLDLQRRLSAAGSPIVSAGAHPGIAATNLQANLTGVAKILGPYFTRVVGQDAAHGALPTLFAATSPDVVPGGYYGPDGRSEWKGSTAPARIPPAAVDADVARRLLAEAERLTGVVLQIAHPASQRGTGARNSGETAGQ